MLDSGLFHAEVSLIVGGLVVVALRGLIAVCHHRGWPVSSLPIWVGSAARLAAVAVAAIFPAIGHKLSSTDEAAFLATSHRLAALPLTDGKWLSMTVHWTEVIPWALTFKLFGGGCGTLALRLEQIGLSLAAVVIVSATAARIGGRRAGLITAWVAALEPSSVYFTGLIHQESLSMVGEALLLAALVDYWIRVSSGPSARSVGWLGGVAAVVGLALIFGTRSYMAFFAGVAAVLVVVGARLCHRLGFPRGLLTLGAGTVVLALVGIWVAPHVVPHSLANLQHQLDIDYVGANLPLGHADVLSSAGLLKTVVLRSLDLVLRPYPWQLGNVSQRVAVAGTLIWYVLLLIAVALVLRDGSDDRLVPVAILLLCETVGFALTLVDAGEGFRHRINLIVLLAVPLGVLGERHFAGRLADRRLAGRLGDRLNHRLSPIDRPGRLRLGHRIPSIGAAAGLIVALGFAISLPTRDRATVAVELPTGARVSAPAGAQLTPQAQLYGALGPDQAPASVIFPAVAGSGRAASAAAVGAADRWRAALGRNVRDGATIEPTVSIRSPRVLRDSLLGLLAGLLLAVAAVLVPRRN